MPTLLSTRRFLPLFIAQFLGAANDNFFKNAMLVLVVFRIAGEAGVNGSEIVNIAAALFILPSSDRRNTPSCQSCWPRRNWLQAMP